MECRSCDACNEAKTEFVTDDVPESVKGGGVLGECTNPIGDDAHREYTTCRSEVPDVCAEIDGDTGDAEVIVGFDVEWVQDRRNPLRNRVLAYGLSVSHGDNSHEMVVLPSGHARSNRKSLGDLLGRAIPAAIEAGVIDGWPERLTVAVFFGRGDIAGLRDFQKLRPGLDVLRGGFVSRRGGSEVHV